MSKASLLGSEGDEGVEGKCESSFKETLNVEEVPSSPVCPEGVLMVKKSLLGSVGEAGSAGAGDSLRTTLNVDAVPSSEVLPERLVIVKKVLLSAEALSGVA